MTSLLGGLFAQSYVYDWGVSFGGSGELVILAMDVDDDGNVYSTGYFAENADLDPGPGTLELVNNGFYDIFVQKLDSEGNLLWAHNYGGDFFDNGSGIHVDSDGHVYVTGAYEETVDFDSGSETFELTSQGMQDIFVLKLTADGDFAWARSMGGTGYEEAKAVGVDADGSVYVSGYFLEPCDFDPGEDSFILESDEGQAAFVAKLNSEGAFQWARAIGVEDQTLALGMAVNDFGDSFITGMFSGTIDFDPGFGEQLIEAPGSNGGYVLKLNSAGEFSFVTVFGSDQNLTSWDIAIDNLGSAFAVGEFRGEFTAGEVTLNSADINSDAFTLKVNPFGEIEWVSALQGTDYQNIYDVAIDPSGNVVVAGYFNGTADFDPSEEGNVELTAQSTEPFDAFYAVYDMFGSYVSAGQFAGSNFTDHHGVGTDAEGNIYLASAFQATADLNPDPEATAEVTSTAFRDSYVFKLVEGVVSTTAYLSDAAKPAVFPNPATTDLVIEVPNHIEGYVISDVSGRTVQSGSFAGGESTRISVARLKAGVYILQVPGFAPVKWVKE